MEALLRGTSNEYPRHSFMRRNKKTVHFSMWSYINYRNRPKYCTVRLAF